VTTRHRSDASNELELFAELELAPDLELDSVMRRRRVAVRAGPRRKVEMSAVLAPEAELEALGFVPQTVVDARLHWKG
jgi:hypothetical protein